MLRIHFTRQTPERLHIAREPDAMWETLLSLHLLQDPNPDPLDGWRRRVGDLLTPRMRLLAEVAPPWGYSPDFLTPLAGPGSLDEGLDAVLSTPPARMRGELAIVQRQQAVSPAIRDLAAGGKDGLVPLTEAVREYAELALRPEWDNVAAAVESGLVLSDPAPGMPGRHPRLPAGLHHLARWRGSVLEIAYPYDREIRLAGRELRLIPSYFCRRHPIALRDPRLPPIVVYPVTPPQTPPGVKEREPGSRKALAKLLGSTRAAALEVIAGGCTTSELSERLGISNASASEHASVLRSAGLTYSNRTRNTVHHTATQLGRHLLHGSGVLL
ncbi:ArsR/SmtB family transcription factor [Nocardiopsis mangrovi]|uniref:ArsR/SmtB family transcription factor n=1 Tax=Nocardiopsis mangrovi TaxID=1179818 RepID=A0ABV9DWD6_9ACTN